MNFKPIIAAVFLFAAAGRQANAQQTVGQIQPVDMNRVTEIARMLPDRPRGMCATYKERAVWDKFRKDAPTKMGNLIKRADKLLESDFPAWDRDRYMRMFTHGDSESGKKLIYSRTNWIYPLAWAECLEDNGKYVETLQMVIDEILKQETWVYPRNYTKETGGGMVELSTATISDMISQAMYMMDDKFPPEFRQRVLDELYTRTFNPILNTLDGKFKGHWWLRGTNNWNSHCLQGVTNAALTMIPDKTERAKFVAIAERYIQNYVRGITPDGYCSEGMGYYNMGFIGYMILRENIMQATGGRLDIFRDNPYIINFALYPINSELTPGIYPAIADCPSGAKSSPVISGYMSKVLGLGLPEESYSALGQPDAVRAFISTMPEYGVKADYLAGDFKIDRMRYYFRDAGILTSRNTPDRQPLMGVVLKGGNNAEHHNHNDLGSFTIAVGKQLMVADPGLITYTAKTFGPERYTIKTLASYGHPVPLIAGKQQVPGKEAMAKVLKTDFTAEKDVFAIDYASAYKPVVPELETLTREFVFTRGKKPSLTVTDEFSFSSPQTFETAIITRGEWKQLDGNTIEITAGGERLLVSIAAPKGGVTLSDEVIDEDTGKPQRGKKYTRIAVKVNQPQTKGTLAITYAYAK